MCRAKFDAVCVGKECGIEQRKQDKCLEVAMVRSEGSESQQKRGRLSRSMVKLLGPSSAGEFCCFLPIT